MAFISLALPPGIYRNGTPYQSKGRYYDCNLVRFYSGTIQPHGGWRIKSTTSVTGMGRAIISWHDNTSSSWSAIGTQSHLYAMSRGGVLTDITPSGFTPGRADAVAEGGYGDGTYGSGVYGTPRPDTSEIQEASMWSLDNWGEDLVGVMAEDGIIYQWSLDTGSAAVAVTNAPSAVALLTTNENILMALGAGNSSKTVSWSDAEDNTDWTPTSTNQAGSDVLQTNGVLMQGLRIASGNLIYTDLDVWLASYEANQFVYGFQRKGEGCGAISRNCAVAVDAVATAYGAQAVWMGNEGFWMYNGYIMPLKCDVWDFVFNGMNTLQKSKVTVQANSAFGEITWRYPSASSLEIDRYVTWNYRENHWAVGALARLSGVDAGAASQFPMMVGTDGNVYEHEVGASYGGVMPYLESGPFELGAGDQVQYANLLMPDDLAAGDVTATFLVKFEPDDAEASFGPYSITRRTDVRFCGRQIRVRFDGATMTSWRIGAPRLDVTAGGMR